MTAPLRHLRGILDTSKVILLPRIENPAFLPEEPLITAITLAELTVGPPRRHVGRGARRSAGASPAGRGRLRAASLRRQRGARIRTGGRITPALRAQDDRALVRRHDRRHRDRQRTPGLHLQSRRLCGHCRPRCGRRTRAVLTLYPSSHCWLLSVASRRCEYLPEEFTLGDV